MTAPVINVTCAIIEKGGKVLIARRKSGSLAGKWEFPGGKIEEGESPEDCLARELMEEFGITAQVREYLTECIHRYPDSTVRLIAYRVSVPECEFKSIDHDRTEWVTPGDLGKYDLAGADVSIARGMRP